MIALKNILSENKIIKFITVYKEALLQCFFAVLIFILATWRLDEIGQPIILSDEYGYWANSAYFLGQDWSSLTSRIGYYSYGYSLLLIPIRILQAMFDWAWGTMYGAAVILNSLMLVGGYVIAVRISKRYFDTQNWIIRSAVCFVAFCYTSNIFYAHLTMTETTILFFFWMFLYILMKAIDNPNMLNHCLLAVVSVYLYTVHQRTIAILITAVIIVLYQKLFNNNKLRDVAVFWFSMAFCLMIHSMIKHDLQNYFYMNGESKTISELLSYIMSMKTLIIWLAGIVCLVFLYLIEKKKYKIVFSILAAGIVASIVVLSIIGVPLVQSGEAVDSRISNNDFAGQWGKIKGIFSLGGLIRLGVSITGKWFYMVAVTGLVICWGLKDIIKHAFWTVIESIQCMISALKGKEYTGKRILNEKIKDNIWLLGVFLVFIGTFMICAIYKEGLFKNDDLVHGRYNEFLMGIMLIYSFYSLCKDKHWIRTLIISLVLFGLAAVLCEHTLTELKRTEFELCHSVMFGRVFWNFEVPVGKFAIMAKYVLPLGIAFILIMKLATIKLLKYQTIIYTIVLLIPVISWTYLSGQIVDKYIVSVNAKNSKTTPAIAMWIDILDYNNDKNIYYLEDTEYYRYAENIQFMLPDKAVTLTGSAEVSFDEDAFFIMDTAFAKTPEIQEKCEMVVEKKQFSLLVSRNGELMERWENYGKQYK